MNIWANMHNPMIYESEADVVSLHITKAGAWRAMRRNIFAKCVANREYSLLNGKRYACDSEMSWQWFGVKQITVESP